MSVAYLHIADPIFGGHRFEGDVTDRRYPKWIRLVSFNLGFTYQTARLTINSQTARATINSLEFVAQYGRFAHSLTEASQVGTIIKEVIHVTLLSSGCEARRITLANVHVSSFSLKGTSDDAISVSLAFERIKIAYSDGCESSPHASVQTQHRHLIQVPA